MSEVKQDNNQQSTHCSTISSHMLSEINCAGVTIVIGRQYGCGGRALGHFLAEKLRIPYFDKEILTAAAETLGLNREILERIDERKPSLIRSIFSMASGAASGDYSVSSMNAETLYGVQSEVIRQLASKIPCVFVGRTADYILRDNPNMFSIFLHADNETRARNICSRTGINDTTKAIEQARKRDRDRRDYYNYFTGRDWGMAANYDICIDTSHISLQDAADIVLTFIYARLTGKNS